MIPVDCDNLCVFRWYLEQPQKKKKKLYKDIFTIDKSELWKTLKARQRKQMKWDNRKQNMANLSLNR